MAEQERREDPACPRCGYDLRGQEAAWGEACPLEGVCSECGLALRWAEVFYPWRTLVPGFIEHERGPWWRVVWSAFTTAWLALRPWKFWRTVRLETPVRGGRVWAWVGVAVLGVLGVSAGLSTALAAVAVWVMQYTPEWIVYAEPMTLGMVEPHWGLVDGLRVSRGGAWVLAGVGATLMAGLMVLLLPDTRRRAKLRGVHVARGTAYGLAWLVVVLVVRGAWYVVMFGLQIESSYRLATVRRGAFTGPTPLMRVSRWVREAGEVVNEGWWVCGVVTLGWVLLWWRWALREGWRVEEAGKVWWAVAVPAALVFAAVVLHSGAGTRLFL